MLEKIQVTLPRAEIAKAHVRQHFRQDIHGAIEYLGTEFADMFADAITFKRGRTRDISALERAPQRHKADENEPQRNTDGITTFFGVDVTDVGRTFTSNEMANLGPRGQAYVFRERERLGIARSTRGGRGGGRGRGNRHGNHNTDHRRVGAADAVTVDDISSVTQDTKLPPVMTGETRVPTVPTPPGLNPGNNRGSQNGGSFGAGAYQA